MKKTNSIVTAQSLPGVPMDELQEEMMIAYAKELSLKDTPVIPDKVKRLEITDMSFYHSRRATEAFQNINEAANFLVRTHCQSSSCCQTPSWADFSQQALQDIRHWLSDLQTQSCLPPFSPRQLHERTLQTPIVYSTEVGQHTSYCLLDIRGRSFRPALHSYLTAASRDK
jgi:hypothetical protein